MTPLARALVRRIAASGPITVADFMAEALGHPDHGYYITRDPLGAAGDFTTAPEISQMFGELIGLALAQGWVDQGAPGRIVLAELGPGRGTLMADALRATRAVPGFHAALSVHFVETSPTLRAAQARAVPGAIWHDSIATLPEAPLYLVANEFLDALPIRQFIRDGGGWRERMVVTRDGALAFALGPAGAVPLLAGRAAADGTCVEYCPALPGILAEAGRRIARHGGAALFIDYGDWAGSGDTLQAVSRHVFADPLAAPGTADLTAHVDFAAVAAAAAPARASSMTTQGVFLERLGITARAQALARGLTGAQLDAHVGAHRRLTHPDQMGHLFKVIGLTPPAAPPLPGLDP